MTSLAAPKSPRAAPSPATPGGPWTRISAWLLLVCWGVAAASWLLAPEPGEWFDLEDAASRGDVARIEVSDHAHPTTLRTGQSYRATVRVTWKQGWRTHTTDVVETTRHRWPEATPLPPRQGTVAPGSRREPTARMRNTRAQLAAIAPDVPLTETADSRRPAEVLGRHLPNWTLTLTLIAVLGSFTHLILNPRPERATRWAWFWLWCIPGLGTPLYLLGSGATINRRPTNDRIRGLTGFIILLATSTFLSTVFFS